MPPSTGAGNKEWMDHVGITVGGNDLPHDLMDSIVEVMVDTSLHLPAMFVMRFTDNEYKLLDGDTFKLGAAVEIKFAAGRGNMGRVIAGEITAIEPEFGDDLNVTLTVRGYDRSHRLTRGTKTRVFVKTNDNEIVDTVAKEAKLRVQSDNAPGDYEHVFQYNMTDLAFLHQRAERVGFEVFVDDQTLYFRKPRGGRGGITLEWGVTLRSFYPRLTLSGQVDKVIVKGWDAANKREIVAEAGRTDISPQIGLDGGGGQLAAQAFSPANQVVARRVVSSQQDADALAQATFDQINAGFVEAEGVAVGQPDLVAGKTLTIEKLGKRFSGKYMVTSATHVYTQAGYEVHFRVEGTRPKMMADLVSPISENGHSGSWGGVVPAVVTNNSDDQGLGRVKLKFPWMDGEVESDWARVAMAGAGPGRGMYWLPEVNDEVLVAFEHGDFNRPYVVGGLWNGQDAPPESKDDAVKNGRVTTRTLKSRTGNTIRLVDTDGSQKIEIVDSAGCNTITLDVDGRKITIVSKGDVEISSTGKTTIKSTADLSFKSDGNASIEAGGKLTLRGSIVNIN